MKTKLITIILLIITFYKSYGQSMVVEIAWSDVAYTSYNGLLVLYPDNKGVFKVKFYNEDIGWVWVYQNATLTNQYDYLGNCTSFINCSYPKANPYVPYSADNFIVYPNGSMYTQDYMGNWSTLITAVIIQQNYWQSKFQEYGL